MTVTVESALSSVRASASRLHEAVQDLVLIAVEDRPLGTEPHLVTVVHDAALDLAGEAELAQAALRSGEHGQGAGSAPASAEVAESQARINALGTLLVRDLAAAERIKDLTTLGRDHGREAGAWANEIVRCIETCQNLLWTDVQPTLLGYWRELAETIDRTYPPSDGR